MDESLKNKLKEYEIALKNNLFINGPEPSKEDAQLFKLFLDRNYKPSQREYPSIWAWYSLVNLFEDEVIKEWQKQSPNEDKKENKKQNKNENKNESKKEKKNKNKKDKNKENKREKEEKKEEKKEEIEEKEEKKQEVKKEKINLESCICDEPDNLEEKPEYKEKIKDQINKHKDEKSNVFLEINPENEEQDLDRLAKRILKEIKRNGLVWNEKYEIKEVGYKIKKLIMGMNVGLDTSVQDIIDQLETWEEEIQSVDFALFSQC